MVIINNCNNIDNGEISLVKNALNIKYAFNGTGKSTISSAISSTIRGDQNILNSLKPFKYVDNDDIQPFVEGLDDYQSVSVFNDNYVNQYVFQSDELIKNSFEIFIRNEKYDEHIEKINQLVKDIHDVFQNDEDLNELINDLRVFLESFGSTKKGYAKSSVLGKGLDTGNKLNSIPDEIKEYTPFLTKKDTNVKWLKWQLTGREYQVDEDICPYCAKDIVHEKDKISKIQENFDSKEIDSLNKAIQIFEKFEKYFSKETNDKIKEIAENIAGITPEQKEYLNSIRTQAVSLKNRLEELKNIGFLSLKDDVDKVIELVKSYKIDFSFIVFLTSEFIEEKIKKINGSIDSVLERIGEIKGEIIKQNSLINRTIDKYDSEINAFLETAGYNYSVKLEEVDGNYKLKLYHNDCDREVSGVTNHLSYGEKNAFALALFMYSALNDNSDLIILDDPISSFDGNKKFAIINKLFMGSDSFNNKTVLLLTHEFNIVIDTIYNFRGKIVPLPNASFLSTIDGKLTEKSIAKGDIKSFVKIANEKLSSEIDTINKLIYLRRLLELIGEKNLAWNLLSCVFHKVSKPTKHTPDGVVEMTEDEFNIAESAISEYIPGFNYKNELKRVLNDKEMQQLYFDCNCNYEKLQIFRILFDGLEINDVVKKFINETYHIENDYLFQLDPNEYNTIPDYIVKICDAEVSAFVSTKKR